MSWYSRMSKITAADSSTPHWPTCGWKRRMKVINLRHVSRTSIYTASEGLRAAQVLLCFPSTPSFTAPSAAPSHLPPPRPHLLPPGSQQDISRECGVRACGHGGKNTLWTAAPPPPTRSPMLLSWTADPGSSAPQHIYLCIRTRVMIPGLGTVSLWEENRRVNLFSGSSPPLSAGHRPPISFN